MAAFERHAHRTHLVGRSPRPQTRRNDNGRPFHQVNLSISIEANNIRRGNLRKELPFLTFGSMSQNPARPTTVIGVDEVTSTARRLSVVLRRLRSRLREEAGALETGLTLSQLAILQILVNTECTTSELAALEHVTHQAIGQNVAALREAGLVTSHVDERDRRRQVLAPTATGRTLYERLERSREDWLERALAASVSPTELRTLDRSVEIMQRLAHLNL